MSTATLSNPSAFHDNGYFTNLGRAARTLFSALVSVNPQARGETAVHPVVKANVRRFEEELSLYRLYRLSGPYDSVSPALVEELRHIAARS